jgi:hypothetical protein
MAKPTVAMKFRLIAGLFCASALLAGCATSSIAEKGSSISNMDAPDIASAGYQAQDELFAQPYIDVQEWRETPVRHYYVHGGFEGTSTRFSYYFPEATVYQGRFYQHTTPVPDSENLAQEMPPGPFNKIGFSAASGAYFVETNGGGSIDLTKGSRALADPTITAYRANAAAAQFSRHVARQFYRTDRRPYGYLYGGSGGAFRTIGAMESTSGVWDGAVPYVNGSTMAIPNMFTVRMQALRVLRDKFPQIVDAMEPGGSGDPYEGLTDYEASVLREAENMGFPMESWFGWRTMGLHGFAALYGGIRQADPGYFETFWNTPGYLGHDRPELFEGERMQFDSRVMEIITVADAARLGLNADPMQKEDRGAVDTAFLAGTEQGDRVAGFRLAEAPPEQYFLGGELILKSGDLAGDRMMAGRIVGDVVMLGVTDPQQAALVSVGDEVRVDNSNFLAMETYHRHQTPTDGFPVWDQFRDAQGAPIYPQRPFIVGPLFVRSTAGTLLTGKFDGKIILAASLWDREAMPWQADWYLQRALANSGADSARLYFTEHALHGDGRDNEDPSRVVPYTGPLQQALHDVAAWAENGVEPPASTQYRVEGGQVAVPQDAADRLGIQPTVDLTANGAKRAEVRVGEPVRLVGGVGVPPGGGRVVEVSWDFVGAGEFEPVAEVLEGSRGTTAVRHSFSEPGTYFIGLKVISQREEYLGTPYGRLINLDRVRVVVAE